MSPPPSPVHATLTLARDIESARASLGAIRDRLVALPGAPFARTRSRLGKQLRKLDRVLDRISRVSVAGPVDAVVSAFLRDELAGLGPRLAELLDAPEVPKTALKEARRAVKRTRLVIEAHLADPGVAA